MNRRDEMQIICFLFLVNYYFAHCTTFSHFRARKMYYSSMLQSELITMLRMQIQYNTNKHSLNNLRCYKIITLSRSTIIYITEKKLNVK